MESLITAETFNIRVTFNPGLNGRSGTAAERIVILAGGDESIDHAEIRLPIRYPVDEQKGTGGKTSTRGEEAARGPRKSSRETPVVVFVRVSRAIREIMPAVRARRP